MLRYFAIISLFISGVAAYNIENFGQGLCVYEYIAQGSVTYFKDLNGVSSDDPAMLSMTGVVSIVFVILLVFFKRKHIYLITIVIFLILELLLMSMVETASVNKIIYDSIMRCSNYAALVWLIFHILFWILSSVYLLRTNRD